MKSALSVVLFPLFAIGLFVDGKETSNAESVSVTEGDLITLKSGETKIQKGDGVEWRFNGSRIAKISSTSGEISVKAEGPFKDRLQLDKQTGDLNISDIRTTDYGEYNAKVSSTRGSPEMTFAVSVVSADGVRPESVLEGGSVLLRTGLTEIQTDDVIQWRFGQLEFPIAEINRAAGVFKTYDDLDVRFRGRLQLDHQTGSLTITDISATHAGQYKVDITRTRSRYTVYHTQSFNVTVIGSGVSRWYVVVGAVVGFVVGVVLTAIAVVIYYRRKISQLQRPSEENGQNHKKQDTDDPANEETKLQ